MKTKNKKKQLTICEKCEENQIQINIWTKDSGEKRQIKQDSIFKDCRCNFDQIRYPIVECKNDKVELLGLTKFQQCNSCLQRTYYDDYNIVPLPKQSCIQKTCKHKWITNPTAKSKPFKRPNHSLNTEKISWLHPCRTIERRDVNYDFLK